MPSVRTLSISKKFPEGTEALSKVNLQVNDGELMALVGPSGCGKTTLLRIIAGLESASGGELFFGDQKVSHLPPERRDLGMVFRITLFSLIYPFQEIFYWVWKAVHYPK